MTMNGESELLYINRDNTAIRIYRTFTPDLDERNGIAERLTIAAFNFARKNKLKVRPDCPFVITFLEKNKRFEKLLVK
jgi:predicted GNAT family acetyltransferase